MGRIQLRPIIDPYSSPSPKPLGFSSGPAGSRNTPNKDGGSLHREMVTVCPSSGLDPRLLSAGGGELGRKMGMEESETQNTKLVVSSSCARVKEGVGTEKTPWTK